MGLLSILKKRREDRAATEMRRFAQVKQRENEQRIVNIYSTVEDVRLKPEMVQPDFDLTRFVFDNKEYVCDGSIRYSKDNGEVLQDDRFYYADASALRGFLLDLDDLESMVYGPILNIPSLPPLKTKMTLIKPVERLGDISENHAKLQLRPLTKTGRNAKCPVTVYFNAYSSVDAGYGLNTRGDGSHGSISYGQDGRMVKAVVHYWVNYVLYSVRWKIVDGAIALGSIDYNDGASHESVRIYQAS